MSRTYKDVPYRVRMKRAYREGKIEHDHAQLGYSRTFVVERETVFDKKDSAEIYKFRKELEAAGKNFTEEEIIPKAVYSWGDFNFPEVTYTTKKIVFKVKEEVTRTYTSSFCTDYEHYDAVRNVDTRDGLAPACSIPYSVIVDNHSRCSCCRAHPEEPAKINRKAKLKKIAKSFNNGVRFDDLYDDDSELIYEETKYIWD